MAKDEQKRKKFWEDDEPEEESLSQKRANASSPLTSHSNHSDDSSEIEKMIHETRVLMEQTHQLYMHYFTGLEKRVPIEKVRLLETKIVALQRTNTQLTTARFKITQFISQYTTLKELWERKLRDRERS